MSAKRIKTIKERFLLKQRNKEDTQRITYYSPNPLGAILVSLFLLLGALCFVFLSAFVIIGSPESLEDVILRVCLFLFGMFVIASVIAITIFCR